MRPRVIPNRHSGDGRAHRFKRPKGLYIKLDQVVFVMTAKDTGAAERAHSMVQLLNGHSDVRESVEDFRNHTVTWVPTSTTRSVGIWK
jgi:hypothetical protein